MKLCYLTSAFLVLLGASISKAAQDTRDKLSKSQQGPRNGKLFSLFNVVSFKNEGCRTNSGTTGISGINRNGTCYTSSECRNRGGSFSGSCASGFGVCCLFTVQAGGTITENCTYIQNPGFPSGYTDLSNIQWMVAKCSNDVCTLRLDFETFTTAGPTKTDDSVACIDSFTATSSTGFSSPSICGVNQGQHIYIDIGPEAGATGKLDFSFGTSTTVTRTWEIKVTQIECWSNARPYDAGCLQYHTGTTGRITSFNFGQTSSTSYAHLPSQNQNICIRQACGFCCIQYSLCADDNSWAIDNTIDAKAVTGTSCSTDYVEVSNVSGSCASNGSNAGMVSRLCGELFSTVTMGVASQQFVCDCTAPFNVQFISNAIAADSPGAQAQRGFCWEYKQIAC